MSIVASRLTTAPSSWHLSAHLGVPCLILYGFQERIVDLSPVVAFWYGYDFEKGWQMFVLESIREFCDFFFQACKDQLDKKEGDQLLIVVRDDCAFSCEYSNRK